MKVLLVDDDHDEFVLVSQMLGQKGLRVSWAEGYDQALAALASEEWDAVLVDYRLGARSGLDLVRHGSIHHPGMPMIVLTGFADDETDTRAIESGAAGFLAKAEISSSILERTIRYAVRGHHPPPAKRRAHDLTLQAALARGLSIREAARAAGVSERTVYRRMSSPGFRTEVEALEADIRARIVDRAVEALWP